MQYFLCHNQVSPMHACMYVRYIERFQVNEPKRNGSRTEFLKIFGTGTETGIIILTKKKFF